MYALQKRIAVTLGEWELKNELLLSRFREAGVSVVSFLFFLLWKAGNFALGLLRAFVHNPRLVRHVAPGVPAEEVREMQLRRLYEQGPLVR